MYGNNALYICMCRRVNPSTEHSFGCINIFGNLTYNRVPLDGLLEDGVGKSITKIFKGPF